MSAPPSTARYSLVAIAFHWAIAAALVALFWLGWTMTDLPLGPDKLRIYALHKSIGLTVLVAVLLRLGWRLTHKPPPLPEITPPWQRLVAHTTHVTLYLLLFLIPVSGWVFNSSVGFPLSWFGFFDLPSLAAPDRQLKNISHFVHEWLGNAILVLIVLHVAGALHHQFILRDGLIGRMLPGKRSVR